MSVTRRLQRARYRFLNGWLVTWLFVLHHISWTTLPDGTRIRTRLLNGAAR